MSTPEKKYRGPLLMAGFGLLLAGVVVGIVMLIEGAPTAGEGSGGGGGAPAGPPPAAVYVMPVSAMMAREESVVTGTLRATSRAEVAAQESGAVATVLVDEGAVVEADTVLVKLDGRRIDAEVSEAEAQLESSKELENQREAELERAVSEFETDRLLLEEDKAISRSEFLDTQRALAVAEALKNVASQAVAEAQSRFELLQIRREDLQIKAPFAGVVIGRHVEPGEWVAAGEAAVSLVTVDPVEAWLRVPERFLGEVSKDPAGVRVRLSSGGKLFTPTEVIIVPDVEPRSQLFTVVATLDNKAGHLAPGRSITGILPVGAEEPHLRFPVDALVRAPAGDFVFVVGEKGAGPMPPSRKVPVVVHFERDGFAFVRADGVGIKEGDEIVIEGNDRLQPGQPLMVREAKTQGGRPPEAGGDPDPQP